MKKAKKKKSLLSCKKRTKDNKDKAVKKEICVGAESSSQSSGSGSHSQRAKDGDFVTSTPIEEIKEEEKERKVEMGRKEELMFDHLLNSLFLGFL